MTHSSHRRGRTATIFSALSAFLLLATAASPQVMGIGRYVATLFWQSDPAGLERVLTQMDTAAKTFHTAQANLTADQYTKVVDEKETQKGKVYYERRGNEVDMAADIA